MAKTLVTIATYNEIENVPRLVEEIWQVAPQADVLVIDDIFDTGHTFVEVLAQLMQHEPASLRSAVLMRKVGRSEVPIAPDIVMFEIPDEFVVGYGLDYEDRFRNLPYVAALEPEDLSPA